MIEILGKALASNEFKFADLVTRRLPGGSSVHGVAPRAGEWFVGPGIRLPETDDSVVDQASQVLCFFNGLSARLSLFDCVQDLKSSHPSCRDLRCFAPACEQVRGQIRVFRHRAGTYHCLEKSWWRSAPGSSFGQIDSFRE